MMWSIICFFNFIIFVISSMKKTTTQSSKAGRAPFNPKDFERNGVSSEEVLEIKEAFDLFDVEGNGYINPKQLVASMTAFGYQAKNTTLYNAVSECAGNIDFTKFLDLLTARISNKDSKANIKEVFKFFDDEKSGFISIRNLKRVVKEVGENIDDSELQEMIERADIDNDGLISEEEFYAIMTRRSLRIYNQHMIQHFLIFLIVASLANCQEGQKYTNGQAYACFQSKALENCHEEFSRCVQSQPCKQQFQKFNHCSFDDSQTEIDHVFNGYCFRRWYQQSIESKQVIQCIANTCNLLYNSQVGNAELYKCTHYLFLDKEVECGEECELELQSKVADYFFERPIVDLYRQTFDHPEAILLANLVLQQCIGEQGTVKQMLYAEEEQRKQRKSQKKAQKQEQQEL